jgi:tRNA (cytidine/uridine-2'-O-)-methyltransferase
MDKPKFSIVLFAPEIPGNTGSIGRTCVALDIEMILIKPYGFELSEKAVRRAGLDYWKFVKISEFESWADFIEKKNVQKDELLFFENDKEKTFYHAPYKENCYLVFGSETKGIPKEILELHKDQLYSIPMFSNHIRSLNLSNAATAVAMECVRHLVDFKA